MLKLLDIGCGPGTIGNIGLYQTLKKDTQIYGIDFIKKNIDSIKKRFPEGKFLQVNASSLPFPDNYFDKIIARHVLEHVKDLKKVLLEIKRVGKGKSLIIIAVPDQRMEYLLQKILPNYLKSGSHHRRIFTEKSLQQLLKKQKFTILSCQKKKWPWFLITLTLALLSRLTSLIAMEKQSGVFKMKPPYPRFLSCLIHVPHQTVRDVLRREMRKTNYLEIENNYSLYHKLYLVLNGLDKLLFFLNYFIPFEVEIITRNHKS